MRLATCRAIPSHRLAAVPSRSLFTGLQGRPAAVAALLQQGTAAAPPHAWRVARLLAHVSSNGATGDAAMAQTTSTVHIERVPCLQVMLRRALACLAAAGLLAITGGADRDQQCELLHIERVPCLENNYSWLIHEPQHQVTAVVDPAEVEPVVRALEAKQWKLTHILNTHHHWDHTGGNEALKKRYGATVVGPLADRDRIPGIDVALKDGDTYQFGAVEMRVFDTPGHTRGHIALWFPQAQALFPGDTLFALGCGRMFEGHPEMMWASLSKLTALPPETQVYCAHEYTQSNARFAVHADPDNEELQRRKAKIDEMRSQGIPTVPSLLGDELKTNPFLRPDDPGIRKALGIPAGAKSHEAFGVIRAAKDKF